jgi:hypothetical protein
MKATQLHTLKGPPYLFDYAYDVVSGAVWCAPGVSFTTVSLKRNWLAFRWRFDLQGDEKKLDVVICEINRRVDSFNTEQGL